MKLVILAQPAHVSFLTHPSTRCSISVLLVHLKHVLCFHLSILTSLLMCFSVLRPEPETSLEAVLSSPRGMDAETLAAWASKAQLDPNDPRNAAFFRTVR